MCVLQYSSRLVMPHVKWRHPEQRCLGEKPSCEVMKLYFDRYRCNNVCLLFVIVKDDLHIYLVLSFSSKMAQYKGAASEAGRAMILMKKRQREQQELEHRRKKIEEELKIGNISNKFAAHYDAVEQQLKSDTIGMLYVGLCSKT